MWAIGKPPTARTWTVDDNGPADFQTIQEAVDMATDGDTLFVYNGTYQEQVMVTKPLDLFGEDRSNTIIHGGIRITQYISTVTISGFTIMNGEDGIEFDGWSFGDVISNNIITKNGYGITGNYNCLKFKISNNTITSNHFCGIAPGFDLGVISNNTITNHTGIFSSGIEIGEIGNDILITGNLIANNSKGIHVLLETEGNVIYNNNFINNTIHVKMRVSTYTWDADYLAGGNYWSDYTSIDQYSGSHQNETNSDGIWDQPYVIDEYNRDNYPLVINFQYWNDPIPGDLNWDGKVRIDDVYIAVGSFGSCLDHPRWNPAVDVNGDGRVRVDDILMIALNFGKTL